MPVTLGDKRSSYSTVKNWVPAFRTGHLSTENEERSGRPTQVTVPENVDSIHSMILDDRRISAIRTAGTLAISRERVGYSHTHTIVGYSVTLYVTYITDDDPLRPKHIMHHVVISTKTVKPR
jgi:hypothetical protein